MSKTLNSRTKQKYDTSANWTSNNPVLLAGEIGIESNTKKTKIGDGTTAWNSLEYAFNIDTNKTVTASTATTVTGAYNSSTGVISVLKQTTGLSAGTYTLSALLQHLVNYSHKHSLVNLDINCTYNCTSDCNCNCDCGDGG